MVERQAVRDRISIRLALGKHVSQEMWDLVTPKRKTPEPTVDEDLSRLADELNGCAHVKFLTPEDKPCRPAQLVYFFQRDLDALIKIGVSTQVVERRHQLETAVGCHLTLIGIELGGFTRESRLHSQFAALRKHGEWFRPGQQLLSYLSALRPESERLLSM